MSEAPPPCRLFLIDDHAIVRQGIAALLAKEPEFTICGEAGTYEEGLEGVIREKPDALVLDLSLRDKSGLTLIKELRHNGYAGPILVLSMHEEAMYAPKAIHAGAQGFVSKDRADEDLPEALRTILAGGIYVRENIRAALSGDEPAEGAGENEYGLTHREQEILLAIGEGLATREIAERFGLSGRTVEVHRANIRKKLDCNTRAEMLMMAMEYRRAQEPPPPDAVPGP